MTEFRVVEAKPFHCGRMCRILRTEHHEALAMIGADIHRELRAAFDASCIRKAWLIDGELAALGGISGSALDAAGYVWLALSKKATHYPVALLKEAKRQLAEVMRTKRELATTIIPTDEAALRLAVFLGFHVAHEGRGQPAFSRFSRRDLAAFICENPDLRIPVGRSYVTPMGYHAEAS